jgi:RNA polymerase sigma-70 factor (ECF subfamily)
MTNDSDLLTRLARSERQAFAEVYDLFSPGLYRYAHRLLGDADTAEDCVAETFSRFLEALRRGKGPRDYLQAYLYRVAHNWITDYYHRSPPPAEELPETQPDVKPLPESETVRREGQTRLRAALACLTEEQRQVIALKYLEELENEEVARILEKPVGAVKSLQHRALASLKRLLEKDDGQ